MAFVIFEHLSRPRLKEQYTTTYDSRYYLPAQHSCENGSATTLCKHSALYVAITNIPRPHDSRIRTVIDSKYLTLHKVKSHRTFRSVHFDKWTVIIIASRGVLKWLLPSSEIMIDSVRLRAFSNENITIHSNPCWWKNLLQSDVIIVNVYYNTIVLLITNINCMWII